MNSFSDQICNAAEETVLLALRLDLKGEWDGGVCWWPGVVSGWDEWVSRRRGKPVKEEALRSCLLGLSVPESSFRKPGAHAWVDLNCISFVYRTKRCKDGSGILLLSPHIRGRRFNECSHLFRAAVGDPGELARMMLELNECIPAARAVAAEALVKGYQERTMRAIRHQAAGVWLQDYFQGEIPGNYIGYEIADSTPGAMDIIRLIFHNADAPAWDKRFFNIPYEFREFLKRDDVVEFAADLSLRMGTLEMFRDDESGEDVPVIFIKSDDNPLEEEEDDDDF